MTRDGGTLPTLAGPRRCPPRCVYCGDDVRYPRLPYVPTCERHADLPALDSHFAFRARRVPSMLDELWQAVKR